MRVLAAAVSALLFSTPAWAQLPLTPPQTEGPYYPSPRLKPVETDHDLTRVGSGAPAKGDIIDIKGRVVAPDGQPIAGTRIEIWQTDSQGIYLHPGDGNVKRRDTAFQFYGEASADEAGAFTFRTIQPARYPGRARHIHVKVTPPRGQTLTTQLYFKDDADLSRDGPAAALGKALASVSLAPARNAATGNLEATVQFVVRRPR